LYRGEKKEREEWKEKPWQKDIGIYGMALRSVGPKGKSRRVPMAGIVLQVSKQVGRINSLALALESDYDQSLAERLQKDSLSASGTRVMFSAGHGFLLGKFILSQRLGIYVHDPSPYYDFLFHNWGLHYRIGEHFIAGFNLKAHRQVAEYASLRIVYSF
jgi:hypothetical protein